MRTRNCIKALLILILLLAAGCSAKPERGKRHLFVSILPQRYIISRIAGDAFDVRVMVQPGHSPETYEPLPRQMAELTKAEAFFTIGVPFEKAWLDKIAEANPSMKIVNTIEGQKLRQFDELEHDENHDEHQTEEDENSHDHSGSDPHTWLSPSALKLQAMNICKALIQLDPEHTATYEKNLQNLIADLDLCIEEINTSLKGLKTREFMVFHPAFGYFADEFDLKQLAIEVEGKEPGPETLKTMIDIAKKHDIRIIFVQKQFSTDSAEALTEAIGGSVVQIDPLEEDYIKNLHHIAEEISRTLQ